MAPSLLARRGIRGAAGLSRVKPPGRPPARQAHSWWSPARPGRARPQVCRVLDTSLSLSLSPLSPLSHSLSPPSPLSLLPSLPPTHPLSLPPSLPRSLAPSPSLTHSLPSSLPSCLPPCLPASLSPSVLPSLPSRDSELVTQPCACQDCGLRGRLSAGPSLSHGDSAPGGVGRFLARARERNERSCRGATCS